MVEGEFALGDKQLAECAAEQERVGALFAYVRRLRGLIVDYDTGAGGEPCYAMETGCRCRNCRALEAEARAIREEG
jgi:hypothetical protein